MTYWLLVTAVALAAIPVALLPVSRGVPVPRYVVRGLVSDVEDWRRSRGLTRRDVIAVSTTNPNAVRGLSGPFEVVTLESWAHASQRVRDEVDRNIRLAQLAGGRA